MILYLTFSLALFNFMSISAGRVLLMLYALKLGAQPFAVGMLAAMFAALPTLLSWQAGKLCDRFGSRWTLIGSTASAACGMLVPYFIPRLPALYVAAMMTGLVYAFSGVSVQNLVGLLSKPHNRAKNFSNYSLMNSVGNFLGPMIAGFSIDHSGHSATCFYIFMLSLVSVALLAIWGGTLPGGSRDIPPAESVGEMLKDTRLWRVLATSSLVITGVTLFAFYMPVYGNSIGLSAAAIGVVLAMYSAAAFVARLILPRIIARSGEMKVLAYAFFVAAFGLMLVPCFKSYPMLGLVSFLFGLGIGCGQPITIMLTFSNSVEGHSGEALGVRITIVQMTCLIVPLVFGALGSAFGAFSVFWVNALMLACGGALTLPRRTDLMSMH